MKARHELVREFAFPFTVLLIGLACTALVTVQMAHTAMALDLERFEVTVDRLDDSIRDRLDMYTALLRAGTGLLAAADISSPEAFRAFVDRLELHTWYPGVQGVGYSARIAAADLPRVIERQRRAGRAGFHVWPADARPEYQVILYLEPLDRRNAAAIGYDMFTEHARREAMERARDTGQPAASGIVTLVQEIDARKQPGLLIYMPVYEGGAVPATVEARRAKLRGFVYSPFRAGDLFMGIYGRNPRPRAGFALYDGAPAPERLFYRSGPADGQPQFTTARSIPVGGRLWTVVVASNPELEQGSSLRFVPVIRWGGVSVTVLLTTLALLQTRARRRAERSETMAEDALRRFQQLANCIPQLAWTATPEGAVDWFNNRWYEYTGTTPAQMLGWGWERVCDPDVLPGLLERWQDTLRTGEPFDMEYPLRGADGKYRLFLTRVVPFRDGAGRIVHWFGTSTDVQYRHDAERSLQEQADTLSIVNHTGTQLAGELELGRLVQAVTDAGTKLTHAQVGAFFFNPDNPPGEPYTVSTASGQPEDARLDLALPADPGLLLATFRGDAVVRSDDISRDPRYPRRRTGDRRGSNAPEVRSYLAVPVRSRSGEVLGGLFFGHAEPGVFTAQAEDIVCGIAAQAAIAIDNARLYGRVQQLLESERTARAEAERVSRLKDEFLATLSHELRTPLNAVVGWAHMLSGGTLSDERRRQAVDTILRNARIQSRLIEDLLDMSRIVSGRLRIEMAPVDVHDVVDAAVNIVRPTALAKRVDVSVTADSQRSVVRGDANRLQQVVWNLLTNAIKFTPSGGRVWVDVRRRERDVEIVVSDTGIGIEPGFLPHVFERFRQADGSYTRGHGGLGIGLSIVRSVVEIHAGYVRAHSEGANRGATFTVRLPIAEAGAALPAHEGPPHGRVAPPATGVLAGFGILLVDDDPDSLELTREILRENGASVRTADSGAEALRLLEQGTDPVHLIVSDIGMPKMDGYELMRRIRSRADRAGASAPAIALTAYAGADDQVRATTAGYDLHLSKPFTPGELIAACSTLTRAGAGGA